MLGSISDAVCYVNSNRQIEYWNEGAENLTGYKFEEVRGKDFSEVIHYEDISGTRLSAYGYPVTLCLQTSGSVVSNLFLICRDNHKIYIEENASPVLKGKKIIGPLFT